MGEAGRAGGGDGSGVAGATGAHRGLEPFFPRRPRRREPHGTLGFWAVAKRRPRDCCGSPCIWSFCDPDSPAGPSHTSTREPPLPPAAGCTAAAETTFPLWPPLPTPPHKKKGTGTGRGPSTQTSGIVS